MVRMPWVVYLWPGLASIQDRGSWFGLLIALMFAMTLNLLLATTLVWTEIEPFTGSTRITIWGVTVFLWGVICTTGWVRRDTRRTLPHDQRGDDLMCEVQQYYLQRNWFEAEKRLKRMIRRNPRDVDARLMLVGVLRRSDRSDVAVSQLNCIERIEGIDRWRWEIDRERRFLDDAGFSDESDETGDGFADPAVEDERSGPEEVLQEGFINPAA